jgi:NDP-sugar pyrophosphorylase family protein
MKAVILAGGFGTRLRPLTLTTPKPVVPIFDRPLLYHQVELLKQLPEIDEVILSLNYQPEAIERVVGDGSDIGLHIRYAIEPTPLGTGGAVKYASIGIDGTVVVLNGDVLTDTDLPAVLDLHRRRDARATIVLTPVENPSTYGLVETNEASDVRRFLEKPSADRITCNTINAGIYILDTTTFDRIPTNTNWSIEREYFPSLVERGDTFVAYVHHGYWIDIGTPEKYIQAHRDIMAGACHAHPYASDATDQPHVAADAIVDPEARLEGPCYIARHARVEAGARITPHSVVGMSASVGAGAVIDGAILWPGSTVGPEATIRHAILGRDVTVEEHAIVGPGAVIGDKSVITRYSRTT